VVFAAPGTQIFRAQLMPLNATVGGGAEGTVTLTINDDTLTINYTDEAREAPSDSVGGHDSWRADILGSNVLTTSTSSPAVDDVRWVRSLSTRLSSWR